MSNTIASWLNAAADKLARAGISSARIDSELMLARALNKDRTYLTTRRDEAVDDSQLIRLNNLLNRRIAGEPIAYILGHKEFFGHEFKTDERALIPRGESEYLVEITLNWLQNKNNPLTIVEIGAGSGAIIISIAKQKPNHRYFAVDISQGALELVQENATSHGATITFLQGDLAQPLLDEAVLADVIIANLPYISSELLKTLDHTITHFEPNLALDGGKDGLSIYRDFFPQAQKLLKPGGLLLCEHDQDQGETMRQLATKYFPKAETKTLPDFLGHDRILYCQT